jgi:preprotein translocase subunit SecE
MGTLVTAAPTGGTEQRDKPDVPGGFEVYKPGEGYATRLGMMVVVASYVLFACHHWYYNWVFLRDFVDDLFSAINLGKLTRWMLDSDWTSRIAFAGTGVILAAGLLSGYYLIYVKRQSAEFLIKTDTELGKVTWPKITPWFKSESLVWGSTYVVLIVVFALTVYVFGVDHVLQWISQKLFYGTSKGGF